MCYSICRKVYIKEPLIVKKKAILRFPLRIRKKIPTVFDISIDG